MNESPYKREPGDLEIRILSDGRLVMVAPDEELTEIARKLSPDSTDAKPTMETSKDAAGTTGDADRDS